METLSKLFGSEVKVKIMRLFLSNPERSFVIKDIASRVKSSGTKVRMELANLEKMGLIKRRIITKPVKKVVRKSPKLKSKKSKKKTVSHLAYNFTLNSQFTHLTALQNFLINTEPLQPKEIIKKVSKLGNIKLIIVSGVFIQEPESRADLLIVGDGIKKANLENTIKTLESEIGKELRYASFTTEDFKYRLSMFDKLTRDILDYPHKKVLNRLGIL